MATDYSINPETGAFSLVSPTQDFVDGGNYTNYYTCSRADTNACSTLYQIKSYKTGTSGGVTYYNVSTVNYEPYAKTTLNDASGLYKSEDDYGDTFYYRGKIDNNYVKFGEFIRLGTTYYPSLSACTSAGNSLDTCNTNTKDMYWRIVRVNGDGSIRLIYSGETPGQEEQGVLLPNSSSRTSAYNTVPYDPTYVGYTYGKDFEEKTSNRTTYNNITKTYQYYFYNEKPTYNSVTETYEFSVNAEVKVGTWYENYEEIIADYPYTCWSTSKTCEKGKPYFTVTGRNNDTQAWGNYTSVSSKNYESTFSSTYDSTIKSNLDKWFEAVFMNSGSYKTDTYGISYENYFSDSSFCNDRSIASGNGYDFVPTTLYGAYNRLLSKKIPSLKCTNKNDRYTVDDTTNGNGWLTYPASLITADEVAMAGGKYGNVNTEYYLYNGDYYWTLSPSNFYQSNASSNVWHVTRAGELNPNYRVHSDYGVRAVLNLKPDVLLASGDGTSMNPYEIKIN